MLMLHQPLRWSTVNKMPTVEDLSNEQNFIAHWMSNSSRAGVLLDPSFTGLKINAENLLPAPESIAAFPGEVQRLSGSCSVSEDSLCEEQLLECGSSCALKQDATETSFPATAYSVGSCKADFGHSKMNGRGKSDCNDPLLQKLEQLKELQQQKQEQLKKQQVEQLQKLMEEQQKLLSMVSGQTAGLGKRTWCPEQKMENLMESGDPHMDPFCAELSENRGKQLWATNAEERPIKAAIQEKKQTFEEFVEEQMQIEEQRLKQKQKLQETNGSAIPKRVIKRPFLKRGEGLTRFTNAKSKITKSGENVLKPPQRALDDRNVRVDRSRMQKKSLLSGKELVSGSPLTPCKKYNQPGRAKCGPIQKTLVLRNHNGKNSSPLETRMQPGKNLDGQIKVSFSSEINNKIENKENVVEFTKSNAGSKIKNKLPDTEKPQFSCEAANAFSNSNCSVSRSVTDSELSFEVSFQNKLENWEKEKEKENLELDEFLFLEQAADEISFSSNSSFVQRILDQDQRTSQGRRMSSTPIKAKQQQVEELAVRLINKKKAECLTVGNKNDKAVDHMISNSETAYRLKDPLNTADSVMFSAPSVTAAPALKSTPWTVNEDKDGENGDTTTDSEEEFETTLKYENEDVKTSFMSRRESDSELLDYGSSATDTGKESKNESANLVLSEQDSSAQSNPKVRKASDHQRGMSCANRNKFEFDDERTWSDLDENYVHDDLPEKYTKMPLQTDCFSKNETPFPDKAIKRKVASRRGEELSKQSAVDSNSNAPPSNLMMKLFPSLKPKQKTGCQPEHEIKSKVEQEAGGAAVPSQILREKLIELETEIERFRAENAALTKLREEREHALASIRKEIADFQQQKAQELAEIEEYRKKEMKKLQRERKVFEKYTTEARAIPDKKERDEIQALKQQIAELQEDLKRKEAKWSTTQRRLKDQIDTLINENMELKEEVRIMERFRLDAWKKVEAVGSKKKAENPGMALQRTESVCLQNRGQKSETGSLLLPAQKCGRINGKSCSEAKVGKVPRAPASAPAKDNSKSETVMTPEDSSKTFMDTSPDEALVSVPSGPAHADSEEIQREITYPDGRVEKVLKNGCHLIFLPNGTWKKVGSDGKTVTITFFNGDVKQIMPDQTVIYYYADAKTTHTTYPDGLEVLQFSNGQIEKHYPDGKKEITFPDQTIKSLFTDGQEESIFPDGTIVRIQRDGSKTIEFNNGQRELHTSQFKRREYPDGTVKTVYSNGHQETKYISGRVRVKDKDGNILMDTKL